MFQDDIVTEWGPQKEPPPATPGKWYRSNLQVGGDPRPGSELPQLAVGEMSMPSGIDDIAAAATCVFTGPTRIRLVGTSAIVTSPGTSPGSLKPGCVSSGASGMVGAGLAEATFSLGASTVFFVQDGGAEGPVGPTNPLFDLGGWTATPIAVGQPAKFHSETTATPAQLASAALDLDPGETLLQSIQALLDRAQPTARA